MSNQKKIIDQLNDLLKQATTERSHYYVAECCRDAIAHINDVHDELKGMYDHHRVTEKIIEDARGKRPREGKALLYNYDKLKTKCETQQEIIVEAAIALEILYESDKEDPIIEISPTLRKQIALAVSKIRAWIKTLQHK